MRDPDELFAKCERDGEDAVRTGIAADSYCTHDEVSTVKEWLRRKDQERASLRDTEVLAVAKEANTFAREANTIARDEAAAAARSARWAKIAAIIAAIAAIISIVTTIVVALLTKN
jgi:hypothetical protein